MGHYDGGDNGDDVETEEYGFIHFDAENKHASIPDESRQTMPPALRS